MGNRVVKVKMNEIEYSVATSASDYFSLELDMQAKDERSTTYMVTASFEGDSAVNASAWAYMIDGTRYAACTTIQYGYKPSMNYAWITVQPQATEVSASSNMTSVQNSTDIPPPKSPEELQKEAEQSGTLSIWHEFSW